MIKDIRIYWINNRITSTEGRDLLTQDTLMTFYIGVLDDEIGTYIIDETNFNEINFKTLEPEHIAINTNNPKAITVRVPSLSEYTVNNQNITLRFEIRFQGFYNQFSFIIGRPLPTINVENILNRLYDWLPPKMYSRSPNSITYKELMGYATMINEIYQDDSITGTVNNFRDAIFPSSGNYRWEQSLNKTIKLLDKDNLNYPKLLHFIHQSKKHSSPHPYFLAFNISKFIALWGQKQRYVYLDEHLAYTQYLNAFLVGNSSIGNCVFIDDYDPILTPLNIYILTNNPDGTSPLTQTEIEYINLWIRDIIPAHISYEIDYTKSSTDLELTPIGSTWLGDPRQGDVRYNTLTFCLAYNPLILEESLGMIRENRNIGYMQNLNSVECISHPTGSTYIISRGALDDPIGGIPLEFTLSPTPATSINPIDYLQVEVMNNHYTSSLISVYNIPIKSYQVEANGVNTAYLYINLLDGNMLDIEGNMIVAKVTYYIGNVNTDEYTYNINITP